MSNSPDFIAHVLEIMRPTAAATARRMFGGHGVYVDDRMCALIADDVLYLKVDAVDRPRFELAGLGPFVYARRGGERAVMSYHRAPDDALDSAAAMSEWLRLAIGAALRAASE